MPKDGYMTSAPPVERASPRALIETSPLLREDLSDRSDVFVVDRREYGPDGDEGSSTTTSVWCATYAIKPRRTARRRTARRCGRSPETGSPRPNHVQLVTGAIGPRTNSSNAFTTTVNHRTNTSVVDFA